MSVRKHVAPHVHLATDIIGNVTSERRQTSSSGYNGTGTLDVSCAIDPLTKGELLSYIWGYDNGIWLPVSLTIPKGESYLRMVDSTTGYYTDLFEVIIDEEATPAEYNPIFGVSTGFVVKKDISCGGYVAANQGLIALGSGMRNQFDPAGIWLFHSSVNSLHDIDTLASPPSSPVSGQMYINSGNDHIYTYNGSSWVDGGDKDNANFYFDTCYIRKASYSSPTLPFATANVPLAYSDLGHLRCANITSGNHNPAATNTYGLGDPTNIWLGVLTTTLYADNLKKLNGDDWFGSSGSDFTSDVVITKATPQLQLKANTASDGSIVFYDDSVLKMSLSYNAGTDQLSVYDHLGSKTLASLTHNGDFGVYRHLTVGSDLVLSTDAAIIKMRNGDTRLYSDADGVLKIQTAAGALATLTASNVYADHINSASGTTIYLLDALRFYTGSAGVKLYDATNDSGSSGEVLTVNASGLPVWTAAGGFNGGTITASLIINGDTYYYALRNGDTRLFSDADGVLKVQTAAGALATLTVSNVYADHINSASGATIYLYDALRFYTGSAGVKLYDATNDSGSSGEVLAVNGSGLPVWTALAAWNGGTVTASIIINGATYYYGLRNGATRLISSNDGVLSVTTSAGALSTINVSNVYADHINSASGATIYLYDHLRFYSGSAGKKLYDATNDSGSSGEVLTVNGSGLPVWTAAGGFNGGTITADLNVQTSGNSAQLLTSRTNDTSYHSCYIARGTDTTAAHPLYAMGIFLGSYNFRIWAWNGTSDTTIMQVTPSNGITFYGDTEINHTGAVYFNLDGTTSCALNLQLSDSTKLTLGHDGSNGSINSVTGSLYLYSATDYVYTENNLVIGDKRVYRDSSYLRSAGSLYSDSYLGCGSLNSSGDADVYYDTDTGLLATQSSALRYKTNVETLTDISWFYQLRPVEFDWKNAELATKRGKQLGLIAEEVALLYPSIVNRNKAGEIETIKYTGLITPLIAASLDQNQRLIDLQQRIVELEKQVATLTKTEIA